MSDIEELAQAVETIREYCAKHEACDDKCRLSAFCNRQKRRGVYVPPEFWPEITRE